MSWLDKLRQKFRRPPASDPPQAAIPEELHPYLEELAEAENTTIEAYLEQIVYAAVLEREEQDTQLASWEDLTPREQEIAALTCYGCTNQQIAAFLHISENTVKTHMRSIFGKFSIHSKQALRETLAVWDFAEWLQLRFGEKIGRL